MFPMVPLGSSSPLSSTTRTSNPGMALPALPGLIPGGGGRGCFESGRAVSGASARPVIGLPDSVDHQLSMT